MKKYFPTVLFFPIIFVFFTISVKVVDVQPVGPLGSEIGWASLNYPVNAFFAEHPFLGGQHFWYTLTNVFGIVAILTAAAFACLGFVQLIRRRSLFKVDREIIMLGVVYAITILLYVLFEKIAINFRPVLDDGKLEASFPSTHTMIVLCIMGTAFTALRKYIADKRLLSCARVICVAVMGLTVIGRLVCGVHWLTDIMGGILISLSIIVYYKVAVANVASQECNERGSAGNAPARNDSNQGKKD